jgi:hypothetical protein
VNKPFLTREQFEYEYMSNPHPQFYWGPSETWAAAVKREIDYRYKIALEEWEKNSIKK